MTRPNQVDGTRWCTFSPSRGLELYLSLHVFVDYGTTRDLRLGQEADYMSGLIGLDSEKGSRTDPAYKHNREILTSMRAKDCETRCRRSSDESVVLCTRPLSVGQRA